MLCRPCPSQRGDSITFDRGTEFTDWPYRQAPFHRTRTGTMRGPLGPLLQNPSHTDHDGAEVVDIGQRRASHNLATDGAEEAVGIIGIKSSLRV